MTQVLDPMLDSHSHFSSSVISKFEENMDLQNVSSLFVYLCFRSRPCFVLKVVREKIVDRPLSCLWMHEGLLVTSGQLQLVSRGLKVGGVEF